MRIFLPAFVAVHSFHSLVQAATYNVISIAGNNHTMGVIVNNKAYPLQASTSLPVLHSGSAPLGNYSYAKLDQAQAVVEKEAFERQPVETSLYEFYNRTWNTRHVVELPTLLDPLPGMDRIDDSQLHPKDHIPTIYLSGDPAQIDLMHSNTTLDTKVTVDMHYIGTDKVTTIKGAEISLAGRSSRWMDKLSYSIKTPKDQDLFSYRSFKLRALRADPSYLREILCYDLMKSMGLPVSGASYIRVLLNDQPVGLFLLIEAYKNDWYQNEFGGGKTLKAGRGITYQGYGAISDLSYNDNITQYELAYKIQEDPDKKHGSPSFDKLVAFTKFLANAPTGDNAAAETWNKHIDMDSVIRSLVVEIIAGFSDGYIANANNYFLYDNLADTRFTYLAADFDTTIGNTMVKLADMWSGNYTQYPGFSLRPLTQKLVQVPTFKSQFEHLLFNVSQHLNVNPRIDDLVNMIRQDVEWDSTLPKLSKGNDKTVEDMFKYLQAHPELLPPPMDWDTIMDLARKIPMSWDTYINGPTNKISLSGVKEWFAHQTKAMQDYFGQHPPV
ncbi:coth protein-domain-containing protein [Chlamydoabsidia padenii]|nr:coth protein-domain-containing protein [Chlamydoabsidia padenii]